VLSTTTTTKIREAAKAESNELMRNNRMSLRSGRRLTATSRKAGASPDDNGHAVEAEARTQKRRAASPKRSIDNVEEGKSVADEAFQKKPRESKPGGIKRGMKLGQKKKRTQVDWFNLCRIFYEIRSEDKGLQRKRFLESEQSGDLFTGTLSEQQSFGHYLKIYAIGGPASSAQIQAAKGHLVAERAQDRTIRDRKRKAVDEESVEVASHAQERRANDNRLVQMMSATTAALQGGRDEAQRRNLGDVTTNLSEAITSYGNIPQGPHSDEMRTILMGSIRALDQERQSLSNDQNPAAL
jgi:hypothetical protein